MSKDTTIISDLRSFFSENENNRAIDAIMRVLECINIRPSQIGTEKKGNCRFTNVQVLNLLMLFPFFVVRSAYRYSGSSLSRLFCCEKDMFYRFMNDGNIKWRKLLYAMNLQLTRKISRSTEAGHDKPVCLIIDDTDAPKSGLKSEPHHGPLAQFPQGIKDVRHALDYRGGILCKVRTYAKSTNSVFWLSDSCMITLLLNFT